MSRSPGHKALQKWRAAQGLTLHAAAERVSVAHTTWFGWERGSLTPSLEKAIAIDNATGGAVTVAAWGLKPQQLRVLREYVERSAGGDSAATSASTLRHDRESSLAAAAVGGGG